MYGVSYSYLQQGFSSNYNLDILMGIVSEDEEEISGTCTDKKDQAGEFTFGKVKPE